MFATIPARFEMGRTHLLLGELAQAQAHLETARQHVREAYQVFHSLEVPVYRARAVQQAQALGLALSC